MCSSSSASERTLRWAVCALLVAVGSVRAEVASAESAAVAAPDAAPLETLRQKCRALARSGQRAEATEACKTAFERGARSASDIRTMVGVAVTGPQQPTPFELARAYQLASLAVRQESAEPWGYAAMCEVAE